jgi:hypothetical protein
MHNTLRSILLTLVLSLFTVPATAQMALEIGMDAGVNVGANGTDVDVTTVSAPVQALRVGVHILKRLSLESSTSFNLTSVQNGPDLTRFRTDLTGLFHLGVDRTRLRPYLKGGLSYRLVDFGEFSDGEFGIVGALGVTVPVIRQVALRFQGGVDAQFSTRNDFTGLVGFSVFTR